WFCTQSQDWISCQPQTDAMPLRSHCARTASGSTVACLLTQAGKQPQQLPTFLTSPTLATGQDASGVAGTAVVTGEDAGVGVAAAATSARGAQATSSSARQAPARWRKRSIAMLRPSPPRCRAARRCG